MRFSRSMGVTFSGRGPAGPRAGGNAVLGASIVNPDGRRRQLAGGRPRPGGTPGEGLVAGVAGFHRHAQDIVIGGDQAVRGALEQDPAPDAAGGSPAAADTSRSKWSPGQVRACRPRLARSLVVVQRIGQDLEEPAKVRPDGLMLSIVSACTSDARLIAVAPAAAGGLAAWRAGRHVGPDLARGGNQLREPGPAWESRADTRLSRPCAAIAPSRREGLTPMTVSRCTLPAFCSRSFLHARPGIHPPRQAAV